ncbi:ArsR family transcriptional regulator [Imperialibacter roseus]|uniref:ArsR family transcriptional regulator n=1 Tax=Imperialibacter roseus TaxID=1324217 RepID=A0ABZ0INJ9_9BACT|nr:ArsR family transcriptional regulator [Imperialibacter roseus]WOK06301.1 ArsR family transcriptional regulator [Imperialibacter roseus]
MLEPLITSKTRLKLLLKFFSNSNTQSYLRSLADEFNESTNAVRVELNRLSDAGFLQSQTRGNTIVYQANKLHPLFPEITGIVSKYLGLDRLAEHVIDQLGDLQHAWVVGDYALGKDTGLIDLVLVGNVDRQYLETLIVKAEGLIHRKIRTLVLDSHELPLFEKELRLTQAIILFTR